MPEGAVFEVRDVLQTSVALRKVAEGAPSMEEAATRLVGYLRDHFVDKAAGRPALSLVRLYVTRRWGDLAPALQDFSWAAGPDAPTRPEVMCLTLLATAGEECAWNDRRASVAHKAIPLPSVEVLRRSPMVAQLVEQLGLDPRHVIEPDPALLRDLAERTYNAFFIPEALDSPYVPAQSDFVIPYGIRSVVGFGGVLPDGMLFAVIMFSSVPIDATTTDAFATMALSVKLALLGHVGAGVFADQPALPRSPPAHEPPLELVLARAQAMTLSQLLDLRAEVIEDDTARHDTELSQAEERAQELATSRAALTLSEARKAAIIEGCPDSIVGMDANGCITDFNKAAEDAFGYDRSEVIGQTLAEVLIPYAMRDKHRAGLSKLIATGVGPLLGRRIEVNALRRDGTEFPVELVVTPVGEAEPPLFNGYIRDLTATRHAAQELAASRERLAHIARTLQASLLPPALPEIEGFELAAAYRAFGDGYEVGGDFYDVFELADGRWALSLGDVCGKGSEAAAITALARYTLRAAAMRDREPSAVLTTLNGAIHSQYPHQFCTAVFATLEPSSGAIAIGLGGHPQPVLLRSTGEVSMVGIGGPLLGYFADWQAPTHDMFLSPGDTLILYSDGLTEARAKPKFFGDERLESTVRSSIGMTVRDTVRLIEANVLDFAGQLSDDLAILAIRRIDLEH